MVVNSHDVQKITNFSEESGVRERERERQTNRQTERHRETDRER